MDKAFVFKLLKTVCLILVWACLGLFCEITGVTLQDLKENTLSDYEVIGQAVSMRMCGYGAGALFGGWLIDKLKNFGDLMISVSLTVAALVCVAIAYTTQIELMFVEFTVQGIMETWIAIAGQISVVSLWREKVSGPMHLLHLGYGAGGFLVPQIAKPFLSKRIPKTASKFYLRNCLSSNQSDTDFQQYQNSTTIEDSAFENGYLIIMGIILVVAVVFVGFFYQSFRQNSTEEKTVVEKSRKSASEIFNFNSCSPGHPRYAGVLFIFIFIWFYIAVGGQMVFATYIYSYCRDMLCISKDMAANIQSTFWIGFTAGRFAGFVGAIWIPMKILIFIEAAGNLVSALVLYFNPSNEVIVWVFSGISGFFVGPLYPSGIAWANRYITMTGLAYTITLIGGSLAGVSFIVAIGWFFEKQGPAMFWYFVIGYSSLACLTALCMHLVARTRGDKYERNEQIEKEEAEDTF